MDYELTVTKSALQNAILRSGIGYADNSSMPDSVSRVMRECVGVISEKLGAKKSLVAHALGEFHHAALIAERIAAADLLQSLGADANHINEKGLNAIFVHLISDKPRSAMTCLSANLIDVNARIPMARESEFFAIGATPLHVASHMVLASKTSPEEFYEFAVTALECGADASAKDINGVTPLYSVVSATVNNATKSRHLRNDLAVLLVDFDADPFMGSPNNPNDCSENSLLGKAVLSMDRDMGILLGAKSSRPTHEISRKMLGAFFVAVVNNRREAMQSLFEFGCDPNEELAGHKLEDYLSGVSSETAQLARTLATQAAVRKELDGAEIDAKTVKPSRMSPI